MSDPHYPAGVTDRNLESDLHSCDLDAANAESARREDEAFEKKREEEVNLDRVAEQDAIGYRTRTESGQP